MPQELDQTKGYGLATLARELGFASDETDRLLSLDPDREIAREALLKARCSRYFQYDETAFERF